MIKATKLTKYFENKTVLNRISFTIERENKIALTGFNGVGKTTLLNIIAGEESYSNGLLEIQKEVKIGFLPQDLKPHNETKVLDFLKKESGLSNEDLDEKFLRKVEIMFAGFALPSLSEIKDKKIGELSSGQKTKLFLTSILLKDSDLLLLDEPTNNLDLPALIWLEDYLKKIDSACIIVSHDRAFLDAVANKVFEIDWDDHSLHISKAKYSDYLNERAQEKKSLKQEHNLQKEEINRLKTSAKNTQEKAISGMKWKSKDNDKMLEGFNRNRAARSFTTAKVTYNRIRRMNIVEKPKERKTLSMNIIADAEVGSQNILLKDAICGYPNGFSIGPINIDIPFGKKICFVGANGSGKTTILKTIIGNLDLLKGERLVDDGVRFGNVMQEHESLPKNETPLSFLFKALGPESEKELIYNHLVSFSFSDESIDSPIKNLSPGERARLLFAYFSATNVNTLILDEPTNHLDMEAEEALEEALKKFEGTIITVTHDRRFVEKTKFDALYIVSEAGLNPVKDFKEYVKEMEKKAGKLMRMLGK